MPQVEKLGVHAVQNEKKHPSTSLSVKVLFSIFPSTLNTGIFILIFTLCGNAQEEKPFPTRAEFHFEKVLHFLGPKIRSCLCYGDLGGRDA